MASFPEDPLPQQVDERIRTLRLKLLEDMELLAGAIFKPDDEDDREAVLMIAESLHHLSEAFLELR